MATTFAKPAPSQEQQPTSTHMGFENTTSGMPQWAPQCDLPLYRMVHSGNGSLYQQHPELTPDYAAVPDYTSHGLPYVDNYNLSYPTFSTDGYRPRSYPNGIGLSSTMDGMQESFPPSAYLIEPQRPQDMLDSPDHVASAQLSQMPHNDEYDMHRRPQIKREGPTVYTMAGGSASSTRCSTPHDELPRRPAEFKGEYSGDDAAVDKEQPYAQLIWKALMGVEGHTMVLRDIYNWFKDNTDKATDKETKGWQNSIRHNLSMNGAFEKVDQPGEDARKGFMWKLTNEAIREGVKSTTRYRSKQPSKRNYRSGNPQPQRQASGAKGGQAAKRSARLRRSNRASEMSNAYRSDPYMARPMPQVAYSPAFETAFPASPYFGSESDFGTSMESDGFASPFLGQPLQLPAYTASPHQSLRVDSAYIIPPADPQEPLFYDDTPSNTSSPPADEPLTPESPTDWNMDPTSAMNEPFVFEDYNPNYRELLP
ncbi:hypothetical protein BDV96DRAFT_650628 [Lophiotrema nucula]|uniref:Fork-head domain-containing protein n=1 Tax=Lophiotrema nucula TaxID=690887 RepID=A0A6A5YV76_9PLEO|nr:hypothetical protein BDV96DRAFT_650628 [Lophiotrema nucula]